MARNSRSTASRYFIYLLVAALVGVITVAIREIADYLLGERTPARYAVSVVLAYGCGIVISYLWQGTLTFRKHRNERSLDRFALFTVVAVGASLLVGLVSRLLLYEAGFDVFFGEFGPALAFAFAAVLISPVSYAVSARYVFSSKAGRTSVQKLDDFG
jgi:putative flippase GtrA